MSKLYVYDVETYKNFFCCSFYCYESDEHVTFIIDETRNDRNKIKKFAQGKVLVGYNSKTFDNIILNYVWKHKATCEDLYNIAGKIIRLQREDSKNGTMTYYTEFNDYLRNDEYQSIDLMRLLFSKKLRVGLKELECSLNHDNVEELPYPFDSELDSTQKLKVIAYNINDCKATKLVLQKSIDALKLRRWMYETYGIDAYSMDGVNGGVKILEVLYEREVGNREFFKQRTYRNYINIKDVILPLVKFETPEFQAVLRKYQDHIWYSKNYDEKLNKDSGFSFEPLIQGFKFKFSLGGLHGYTQSRVWESNDEYDVISIDVASYYPSQVLEHHFVPEHLNKEIFLKIYGGVKVERLIAKKAGDKIKDTTLKLSINGTYGMFGNQFSWLFDHKVRLQICVNGQLMLAMLVEQLFKEGIVLIDANTDGLYVYLHKSKRERFNEIIKWWEAATKMVMEETKFEKIWFLNTGDYFGTTKSVDKKTGETKIDIRKKGMFIDEVQLGKGMEFPVIAQSVKKYFLEGIPYRDYILGHDNILDFCSYKKLKHAFECFHNNEKQQRVNRFYACKTGAYLYKRKFDENKKKYQTDHVLKDSPVALLNKLDKKPMTERNINYSFYLGKAREIIYSIEGDKNATSLF